ncbi:LacI family DNA-binding transcriptional regulator [Miniimonas arenae]|uniref:LacI family DNA-binding transcriptional regulator n=1 Tax=Miniimonas arenae TaxID=676201 RepID=UPI0028B05D67|nr:LacI family DNA-binding transcriptional regulator [Miniimonas arenae]
MAEQPEVPREGHDGERTPQEDGSPAVGHEQPSATAPRPGRAPTIYDVARVAGVAPSTVSRTFARPGRVNTDTAARIRAVAAELGYRANPVARALSTARSHMIAVVVPHLANPIYAEMLHGAQAAAAEAGYVLLVEDTHESAAHERTSAERVLPVVDGIVLASSRMSDSAIRAIAKQVPVVVVNRALPDVPSVVTDNARGTRKAVEHLVALGHRDLAYLGGPAASWADGVRWRSFADRARELGVAAQRIGPLRTTVAGGLGATEQARRLGATGLVVYNALMAVGLMRGLSAAGVRVPEDVSVVGFDNIVLAQLVTPSLTTVSSPLSDMGAAAVRNLLALVAGAQPRSGEPLLMPTRLTVRGSSGPAPTSGGRSR